ncbi:hypothetical protein [Fictibacillus barbaricus]|uniref:Uncharacterized protein n=1 Tax=Fictibacillus barbaricus TaxID=182136 RepID=A0ABU1TX61_9BACL|nr:hypothetical protein [Fictibacillus barbaricus]MDR7071787.1 hypothetical protein [Fictibacillus barbaricus]
MAKAFLGLFVASIACFVIYGVLNFHTTWEGAYQELACSKEKTCITLRDQRYVLLINERGDLSLAITKIIYPFGLYEDFKVYPTEMNSHDKLPENGVSYTSISASGELIFGLTNRTDISFMVSVPDLSFSDQDYFKNEAMPLVSINNQKKFWYSYEPSQKGKQPVHIQFLNQQKEKVNVWE